jgi:hypothetical protein
MLATSLRNHARQGATRVDLNLQQENAVGGRDGRRTASAAADA